MIKGEDHVVLVWGPSVFALFKNSLVLPGLENVTEFFVLPVYILSKHATGLDSNVSHMSNTPPTSRQHQGAQEPKCGDNHQKTSTQSFNNNVGKYVHSWWRETEKKKEMILKEGIPRTYYAGGITHIKFKLQRLAKKVAS